MYVNYYTSPVGKLLLASDGTGLAGLWREGQKCFAAGLTGEVREREDPVLEAARDWLDRYFAGEGPSPEELPLAPEGSPFQRRVWERLRLIPRGQVTTYGALAQALGQPTAARAVGGAVGRNPIFIIIPCHRVVGTKGVLTGYAGGLEMKGWLLDHEGADLTHIWIP